MKTFFALCFLIAGCGAPIDEETDHSRIALRLHLPGSLSQTETRRRAFDARVTRLELALSSRAGLTQTLSYPPAEWDRISLAEFDFPRFPEDRLTIQAKVWDRQRDGGARPHPVLAGRAILRAQELAVNGPTVVPIRLSLKLPVSEYD